MKLFFKKTEIIFSRFVIYTLIKNSHSKINQRNAIAITTIAIDIKPTLLEPFFIVIFFICPQRFEPTLPCPNLIASVF